MNLNDILNGIKGLIGAGAQGVQNFMFAPPVQPPAANNIPVPNAPFPTPPPNFFNNIQQGAQKDVQSIANEASNIFHTIGNDTVQGINGINTWAQNQLNTQNQSMQQSNQLATQRWQQLGNAVESQLPKLNPFGNQNVFAQLAQGKFLNQPTTVPFLKPIEQVEGQFVQNRLINPAGQIPGNINLIANPNSSPLQRMVGGLGLAGDVFNYNPEVQGINLLQNLSYGGIKGLRSGQNPLLAGVQNELAQNPVGLGSALTNNKLLAGIGDIAGGFVSPDIAQGIAGLAKSKGIALALKGISPNVFNMHPEDEKLALSLSDTILNTKDKLSALDQKYLQTLAEHYLGGKYVAATNKQIAQAFEYSLATKYKGVLGKLPKMNLLGGEQATGYNNAPGKFSAFKDQPVNDLTGNPQVDEALNKRLPEVAQVKAEDTLNEYNNRLSLGGENTAPIAQETPNMSSAVDIQKSTPIASIAQPGIPTSGADITGENGEPLANLGGKPPLPPTKNNVELPIQGTTEKERVQSAISNAEFIKNSITTKGKDVLRAAQSLSPQDIKLADQYEHGVPIATLAQQAKNPKAFSAFMQKLTDYYDYRLAADRAAGGMTPTRQNYLRHIWDLSKPEDLEKFNEIAVQKGLQPWNGFKAQPRVFNTYAEGEALGFKRMHPTILGDLQQDYQGASKAISQQALRQGLQQAAPDRVSLKGMGQDENGKPFVNSNIEGLEGMSYAKSIDKQLQGFNSLKGTDFGQAVKEKGLLKGAQESGFLGTTGWLWDHATQPMKHLILNLSFFHDLNVGLGNVAGKAVGQVGKGLLLVRPGEVVKGLKLGANFVKATPTLFSEKWVQDIDSKFQNKMVPGKNYSVFDAIQKSGSALDRGLPATGLSKINPLDWTARSTFDRYLHVLKLYVGESIFGDGKIDPVSPEGQAAGRELDLLMGELNNRTMNFDPNTQKNLSRAFLAPSFTLSKFAMLWHALTKGGIQGDIARQAVIGKSIMFGTVASIGTLLMTGQFPTLQRLLLNYTFQPSLQTNQTNPKGRKLDIGLPATFLSELGSPITTTLNTPYNRLAGLEQYGQARLNPMLSGIQQLATNQDYYGNTLINPNSPTPMGKQIVEGIIQGKLPIGLQNVMLQAEGKQNTFQTLVNTLGLRTHVSPEDPTMKYFASLNQTAANLNPTERAIFLNTLHPTTKDAYGNTIIDKTYFTKPTYYASLLNNQNLFNAERQFQLSQPNHHPMWDLQPNVLHAYMQEQLINGVDPSGDKTTIATLKSVLPNNFNQLVNNYYTGLQKQGVNLTTIGAIPIAVSPQLQNELNQYDQMQPGATRTAWLQNHPDVTTYFDQAAQVTNFKRADMGLPMNTNSYTVIPPLSPAQIQNVEQNLLPRYTSLPMGQGQRAAYLQQNPDLYSYLLQAGNQASQGNANAALAIRGLPLVQLMNSTSSYGSSSAYSASKRRIMSDLRYGTKKSNQKVTQILNRVKTRRPVAAIVGRSSAPAVRLAVSHPSLAATRAKYKTFTLGKLGQKYKLAATPKISYGRKHKFNLV